MTIDQLIQLIRDVGFPVAVALFVLIRVERRLHELVIAIVELRIALSRMPRRREDRATG